MQSSRPRSLHSIRVHLLLLAVAAGFAFLADNSLEAQQTENGSFLITLPVDGNPNDHLGEVLATGDFNHDGFDDLAIGQPLLGVGDLGSVSIYFGRSAGLEAAPRLELRRADTLVGSVCARTGGTAQFFGGSLAVGDFDNDGFDDLAIGSENKTVEGIFGLGTVSVFFGRADSTLEAERCFAYGLDGLPGIPADNSFFGRALASGDFDGDGLDDLAIGAAGATIDGQAGAGSVTVISSGANGALDPSTATLWHQNVEGIQGEAELFDAFGSALATGDLVLGLDIACDLVIGAPGDRLGTAVNGRGSVQVLFGCGDNGLGVEDTVRWTSTSFPVGGSADGQRMGSALAVGNFDCVSADDLAIGGPDRMTAAGLGMVFMVYGNQQDPGAVIRTTFQQSSLGGPFDTADRLGDALLAAPLDGPCDDLVVGAPGDRAIAESGALFVLEGRFGIGVTPGFGSHHLWPNESAVRLGDAITAGRYSGRSLSLAAGAPDRTPPGGDVRDGSVWVLPSAKVFSDGFESGDLQAWSLVVGASAPDPGDEF